MTLWFGYIHRNLDSDIQPFSTDAYELAQNNEFYMSVLGPWELQNKEEAKERIKADMRRYIFKGNPLTIVN